MRPALCLVVIVMLVAGCGEDSSPTDSSPTDESLSGKPAALRVTSTDFIHNGKLPAKYTCDGAGDEPVVFAGTAPAATSEIVLVVTDADAPGGTFVHLTRFGMSKRGNGSLEEGVEGANSAGKVGWAPPCPPKGDGRHTYVWTAYALRDESVLEAGAKPAEVTAVLREGVLAKGAMSAFYSR
jgi:phosphatidylethanolamine-binding protein (PEBP) family uncharacterized protein